MSAVSGGETEQVVVGTGVRPPLAVPRRLLRMRSDAALAERFAAGDEAAFDVIYERHRPVVLAVCMGVLGAPPDAEDATQETFSALAVALRTRPPAELRPWLIRVARNASIDTTRRRRHRLLTLDGEIPEVAARPATSGKAELAVVLDGIRELPEGQRMALLMRELGGHSYAEIAEFLETDEESVKGLIARARVGLRSYREATELSCATARTTIAAEPDGRRYDKTIRRHLRTCASCRSYREALRDDAKALRAALPIQAGTVATGSLSSGMLSTAKGSLLGYGLTQAATTCAASACAVGAIGGMVFVAPVHKLGLPPILPAVKAAPHKHHTIAKAAPVTHVVVPVQTAATVYRGAATPVTHSTAAPAKKTAATTGTATHPSASVVQHRHHEPTVTKVHLPKLPPVHKATATAKAPAPSTVAPVSSCRQTPHLRPRSPPASRVSAPVAPRASAPAARPRRAALHQPPSRDRGRAPVTRRVIPTALRNQVQARHRGSARAHTPAAATARSPAATTTHRPEPVRARDPSATATAMTVRFMCCSAARRPRPARPAHRPLRLIPHPQAQHLPLAAPRAARPPPQAAQRPPLRPPPGRGQLTGRSGRTTNPVRVTAEAGTRAPRCSQRARPARAQLPASRPPPPPRAARAPSARVRMAGPVAASPAQGPGAGIQQTGAATTAVGPRPATGASGGR